MSETNGPPIPTGQSIVLPTGRVRAATRKARLVVVQGVYYQPLDGQPTEANSRYGRFLDSDELPYARTVKVGPEWQYIDPGWVGWELGSCGMLVVENLEPQAKVDQTVSPLTLALVQLTLDGAEDYPLLILPGESTRLHPSDITKVKLRCPSGKARVTTTVYPG